MYYCQRLEFVLKINFSTCKPHFKGLVRWLSPQKLLDYFAPGFDWEIRTHYLHNQIVVVEGRLTIKAEEGDFIREATGYEEIGNDGYGNAVNNAEASALRRCCAKFQLGLQFWHK